MVPQCTFWLLKHDDDDDFKLKGMSTYEDHGAKAINDQ